MIDIESWGGTNHAYLREQRPAKLCQIVKEAGWGDPIDAWSFPPAKVARIWFENGSSLIIKPRWVEIGEDKIVDEELEEYLGVVK